jgi:hypothetical protein
MHWNEAVLGGIGCNGIVALEVEVPKHLTSMCGLA